MKKIFFAVVIFATAFVQQSFAQDSTSRAQLSQLLPSYYNIKDALTAENATEAATKAKEFVNTIHSISQNAFSKVTHDALLKDAVMISATTSLKQQRELFAGFSKNMIALAKEVKLSSDPIYEAYCPMKKAYWLSNEKAIKNPYYGSAMLTCGSIKETLK